MKTVEFQVRGERVLADLYLPKVSKAGERRPALVIGNGFSGVKEGLQLHAQRFCDAGYVALVIDYRSCGSSGGEERGRLFPLEQVEDFRGGISYLESLPEVENDRIGIWGTSFGGGVALATAAVDDRVRICISQVPICNGREWMQWLRQPDQWLDLLDRLVLDRRRRFAGEPSERIAVGRPVESRDFCAIPSSPAVMQMTYMMHSTYKTARSDISLESIEKVIEFFPESLVALIAPCPLLMISVTGYETLHPLEPMLRTFAAAREPKRLVQLPFDEVGIYYKDGFAKSLEAQIQFLEEYLPVSAPIGGSVPRTEIPASFS